MMFATPQEDSQHVPMLKLPLFSFPDQLTPIVPSANLDRDLFVVKQSKNTTTRWNN
jgi:hypothetical protein